MPISSEPEKLQAAIRSPRAAAVAGIIFSVLFAVAYVLMRRAVPYDANDPGTWVTSSSKRQQVNLALNLLPFAGIAFLWFVAVMRDYIGDKEDRFFSTVILGSGLLFIAMVLTAGAASAGLLATAPDGAAPPDGVWRMGRHLASALVIMALRMAAVFVGAVTTLAHRVGLAPRWTTVFGYATAILLLVAVGFVPALWLLFPLWVLVISVRILVVAHRPERPATP